MRSKRERNNTSMNLKHECILLPVTAIAFTSAVVLVAHGNILRVYKNGSESKELCKEKIFQYQTIHGIRICQKRVNAQQVLIWGGRQIITVTLHGSPLKISSPSAAISSPDWILDAAFAPSSLGIAGLSQGYSTGDDKIPEQQVRFDAVIVTSHNALLHAKIEESSVLSIQNLSAASPCILYAADIIWLSPTRILVASGTAFGELIIWSCYLDASAEYVQREVITHCFFAAHDGSIFGIRISYLPSLEDGNISECFVATCSDDRTIRIWDATPLLGSSTYSVQDYTAMCLVKIWAHGSRIWQIQPLPTKSHSVLSTVATKWISVGEDATCQEWSFSPSADDGENQYLLLHNRTHSNHSGKNIWALAISSIPSMILTGGADGAIASLRLEVSLNEHVVKENFFPEEFLPNNGDSIKTYAFIAATRLIVTTHGGCVTVWDLMPTGPPGTVQSPNWRDVGKLSELKSYSIVAGSSSLGICFLGSAKGTIYLFYNETLSVFVRLTKKISGLFLQDLGNGSATLLVAEVGLNHAHLFVLETPSLSPPCVFSRQIIDLVPGFVVTSSLYVCLDDDQRALFLGSRHGLISTYLLSQKTGNSTNITSPVLIRAHGENAVTAMVWTRSMIASGIKSSARYLFSTGRGGTYAVHCLLSEAPCRNLELKLVHQSSLPFGPHIEGLFLRHPDQHLIFYGFQSTRFLVWDETMHDEIMKVECGGAHRVWAFNPLPKADGLNGGTFVWTKASKLNSHFQSDSNHSYILRGGHGREIKACAVFPVFGIQDCSTSQLIATGAEDTDIRIFEYSHSSLSSEQSSLRCLQILRKHNTGIQCLQWSKDGKFLFSSAGIEEFFVWRVHRVPFIGVGIVCESACPQDGELSDLRIMAFDTIAISNTSDMKRLNEEDRFIITMVYSDSTVRVYCYRSTPLKQWQLILTGSYLTCCLTKAQFLIANRMRPNLDAGFHLLTGGTDGYLAAWPMEIKQGLQQVENGKTILQFGALNRYKVHQNSIKCLTQASLPPFRKSSQSYLVVTGGDDNALAFTILTIIERPSASATTTAETAIIPRAHAAAITGVAVISTSWPIMSSELPSRLPANQNVEVTVATVSTDQRLKLWRVSLDYIDGVEIQYAWKIADVRRQEALFTGVADAACMDIFTPRIPPESTHVLDDAALLVCGVGMDIITFNCQTKVVQDLEPL